MNNEVTHNPSRGSAQGALVAACFGAAAICDVLTPAGFEPGLLYLPANFLAARRFGPAPALGLSLLAAMLRLMPQLEPFLIVKKGPAAAIWPAISWFGAYAVVVLLTVRWQRSVERAQRLARTDPLTGLGNRTALLERVEAELNRGRRSGTPLSIACFDCDDFKRVNDRLGHAAGDRVLQAAAGALRRGTRSYDLAARPGGDEFVVVLPGTAAEEARAVVARIQSRLNEALSENDCSVTFSIGVATFSLTPPSPSERGFDEATSAEEAVDAADELMYAVKQAGKNGVRFGLFGVTAPAADSA